VALVHELDLAFEFCVIVERIKGESSIITSFPGSYSLSFPYEGQDEEEYKKSILFWQKYILCRKK
jgi:hypothetical protein